MAALVNNGNDVFYENFVACYEEEYRRRAYEEALMRQKREMQEYLLKSPDHYSRGLNPSAQQGTATPSPDPKYDNPVLLLL